LRPDSECNKKAIYEHSAYRKEQPPEFADCMAHKHAKVVQLSQIPRQPGLAWRFPGCCTVYHRTLPFSGSDFIRKIFLIFST